MPAAAVFIGFIAVETGAALAIGSAIASSIGLSVAAGGVAASLAAGTISSAAALAIGSGVVSAGVSIAQGAKASDVLKSAVIGGVASFAGAAAAKAVTSSVATAAAGNAATSSIAASLGRVAGSMASGSVSSATSSILSGQGDPIEALIKGGLTAGLTSGLMEGTRATLSNIPGFDQYDTATGKTIKGSAPESVQRAITAGLTAGVLGKDVDQAVLNSVLRSVVNSGIDYAKIGLKDASENLRSLYDSAESFSFAFDENLARQNSIVEEYNNSANDIEEQRKELQAKVDEYNKAKEIAEGWKPGIIGFLENSVTGESAYKDFSKRNADVAKANNAAAIVNNEFPIYEKARMEAEEKLANLSSELDGLKKEMPSIFEALAQEKTDLDNAILAFQNQEEENAQILSRIVTDTVEAKDLFEDETGEQITQEQLDEFVATGDVKNAVSSYLQTINDERDKAEAERLEAERLEAERLEEERIRQEELQAELERQEEIQRQAEEARLEAQREAARQLEIAEIARLAKEAEDQAEAERLAQEAQDEADRQAQIAAEAQAEAERYFQAVAEAERLEAERLEAERLEAERIEAERLETERLAAEQIEAERILAEEEAARLEAERVEAERLAAIEAERLEAESLAAEQIEAERVLAEDEAARVEAERLEAERLDAERLEAERVAAEKEAEDAEVARIEAERLETERLEAERLEAERLEAEADQVCAPGFHKDPTGLCVPDDDVDTEMGPFEPDGCAPGFHDDGTGFCVPDDDIEPEPVEPDECGPGFHKGPTGLCIPDDDADEETEPVEADDECPEGFHKGPTGLCIPDDDEPEPVEADECEPGFHKGPTGLCIPDEDIEPEECPPGYVRNLNTGVCELPSTTSGGSLGGLGGGTSGGTGGGGGSGGVKAPATAGMMASPFFIPERPIVTAPSINDDPVMRGALPDMPQESKFQGPLDQFLKIATESSFTPKPQQPQQQQAGNMNDRLTYPQGGTDYFSYGQQSDIDNNLYSQFGQAPTDQPMDGALQFRQGGLAVPLMAAGGTRYGQYAGGGLNVVEHSGKHRVDFRKGDAVTGPGDGQSDDIPAMLADGEFVFPADVVAALGNGSTKAGSDKLYDMMHSIRAYHRSAKPKDLPPPAKKSPLDYLKGKKSTKARS